MAYFGLNLSCLVNIFHHRAGIPCDEVPDGTSWGDGYSLGESSIDLNCK